MPFKPEAKTAYQREYMRRRRAEQRASEPKPKPAAKAAAAPRQDERVRELEAEVARLRRRCQDLERDARNSRVGLDPALSRKLRALLHPDKVQHPQAKAQLHVAFTAVNDLLAAAAKTKDPPKPDLAEMARHYEERRAANSARSKEAHARKRAREAAARTPA